MQVVFLLFSIPTVLDNRSAFSAHRFFDLFRSISNRSLNKTIDWLLLQIFGGCCASRNASNFFLTQRRWFSCPYLDHGPVGTDHHLCKRIKRTVASSLFRRSESMISLSRNGMNTTRARKISTIRVLSQAIGALALWRWARSPSAQLRSVR